MPNALVELVDVEETTNVVGIDFGQSIRRAFGSGLQAAETMIELSRRG